MLQTSNVWHAVNACARAIACRYMAIRMQTWKIWCELPQMSNLPGARRSGVRDCRLRISLDCRDDGKRAAGEGLLRTERLHHRRRQAPADTILCLSIEACNPSRS